MRLAVEVTTCTPSRAGVGYFTEHLVDALLETRDVGDEIVLLSNRPPSPELAARWAAHLHVRGPSTRAVWMQAQAPRLLSETRADIAVFPNYVVPLASPCPAVVIVHDLAVLRTPEHFTLRKRLLMRAMLRPSVTAASVIATVSEASRRDIVSLLGVNDERILLLPGAAHPSCSPAPPDAVAKVRSRYGLSRPYLLTVGTLEPRKGLSTLLRAFDQCARYTLDHDLVVVGGRGWRDRQLRRDLEIRVPSQRVRWLGYVPETDLAALYSGAALFVFASTFEGFGLPLLEAMACGAPVMASDIPASREVGGEAPRFVPTGDEAAFACAITQALGDREWLLASRSAGLARARHFSWERTAEVLWARARAIAPPRVSVRGSGMERRTVSAAALPSPLHPLPPSLSLREWALLATVAYADIFDSPLPMDRALTETIGTSLDQAELQGLVQAPGLARVLTLHPSGYLVLAGREYLVDRVPQREARTRELLARTSQLLSLLADLPFVRALVITGGLAHRNPGRRPDVDLFVVAARGRAYTAYTLLVLATKLTATRQLICPNYLVDERELAILYHRDLFTAHQLVSARPFAGQRAYEAWCRANEDWVCPFFPGFTPGFAPDSTGLVVFRDVLEVALQPVAPVMEGLLRWAWCVRIRQRASLAERPDVVLMEGIMKLHMSDYRRKVLTAFGARLESLRKELGPKARATEVALDPVGT